jgi:hypothetical protein
MREPLVGAQRVLLDCEGALVEGLGLSVTALCLEERGEFVEGDGDAGVLGANFILRHGLIPSPWRTDPPDRLAPPAD